VPSVRIVVDSMSYIPPAIVEAFELTVVPLYFDMGDGPIRESAFEGDYADFYERLARSPSASTSPPAPEDFVAAYRPLLEAGHRVVSVHLSSGVSETCANARRAVEMLEAEGVTRGGVAVVDSAGVGAQTAICAVMGARAARAGLEQEQVVERLRTTRAETRGWWLFDTLEYLRRGGRVGAAAAWVGSVLQIKPIITIESEVVAQERVRSRERGIERLVELMRRQASVGADAWTVQHCHSVEDAQRLVDRLREVFRRPPLFVTEAGPVLGTHCGPRALTCAAGPSWGGG
jgi:DegV family protein with EDD domain